MRKDSKEDITEPKSTKAKKEPKQNLQNQKVTLMKIMLINLNTNPMNIYYQNLYKVN